jgi:YD repeat-containing protein
VHANNDHAAVYEYDERGRLTQAVEPEGVVKNYEYDLGGNRVAFETRITGNVRLNTTDTEDARNTRENLTVTGPQCILLIII